MSYITRNLIMIAPYFFISIPVVLIHRILEMKKRQYLGIKTTKYKEVGSIALMYSLILIGTLTLGTSIFFFDLSYIAQHINESLKSINFIPFKGMIEFGVHGFVNILGNIFIFMPFGFCAALLSLKEKRMNYIILQGTAISLFFEIIQIFIIRAMDINDIILNTLGAFLGLRLLIFFRNRYSNFFNKFRKYKPVNQLTLKEKRKAQLITIVQVIVWFIMIINLKHMVLNFYQ